MNGERIEVFADNPSLTGMAYVHPPVRYSREHEDCVVHMITPWKPQDGEKQKRPLIAFVQGSAWTHPDVYYEMAQLASYAREGYVVASIVHRNANDGFPFPAYLVDVKAAVRYLRQNAEEYDIDPERVCLWGTSSGGNTALLVGVTAGDARYETDEYAGVRDDVQAVVDCFGPTDMLAFGDMRSIKEGELLYALTRGKDPNQIGRDMSPIYYPEEGKAYPPMLLIHGDADTIVPYAQSVNMHERLLALGQDSTLIRVTNAEHEANTWSLELHARILKFLKEKL